MSILSHYHILSKTEVHVRRQAVCIKTLLEPTVVQEVTPSLPQGHSSDECRERGDFQGRGMAVVTTDKVGRVAFGIPVKLWLV